MPAGESPDTIYPGGGVPPPLDPRAKLYDNNAPATGRGSVRSTRQMNCVGCHAHGGGGMGPALMDDKWRYGGRIDQIAATIAEGRPNGMPAWRGRLTDDQIWKLAAYVRTLSGQPSKDAVSSRADEMSGTPPANAGAARTNAQRGHGGPMKRAAAATVPALAGRLQLPALPERVRQCAVGATTSS